MNSPEIHILHKSDFYQIRNFKCDCTECHTSGIEFNNEFNLCFVRSGYFEYHVFRKELEVHVGRVMVSKPQFEHVTRHIENQPDLCSVFDFTTSFYDLLKEDYGQEAGWFFKNKDLHAVLLVCAADLDYLHHVIFQQIHNSFSDTMLVDDWVLRLVDKVMRSMGNALPPPPLPSGLKRHHLSTVEKAKEYLVEHFSQNISLQQVAEHCCVSLFHFCRIFKSIMKVTPYQYLSEVRLSHACILLKGGMLPITQIAFQCGFNTLEHFDFAYRQRFKTTPGAFRKATL